MQGNLKNTSSSLPDQKNFELAYELAYKLATERLSSLPDLEEQCRKSDSVCYIDNSSRIVVLKYLNKYYQVSLPDISISVQNRDEEIELRDQILILHYLTRAKGTPLSNRLIAYQELEEGATYFPSFTQRAIKPLADYFGPHPERLVEFAADLGGYKVNYGDVAVTIPAFSRVPITLVLWKEDTEFPPNANVLFDSTILDYLPAEDVSVVCQTISWRLVRSLKRRSNTS